MNQITVTDRMSTGELFDYLLKLVKKEEKSVTINLANPKMGIYDGLAIRDILYTFKGSIDITATVYIPINLNCLAVLSGLPVESRKISPSNLVIFVKEVWFTEGTATAARVTHIEKMAVEEAVLNLISDGSSLSVSEIEEYVKDGKVMLASEAVDRGLLGGIL